MKIQNILSAVLLTTASVSLSVPASFSVQAAEPDPNFHIYICLGQSNMEGNASIEPTDRQNVPERFVMMPTVNFSNPARTKGEWYVAAPPLVRQGTGLTPMDYFGRTMVENLPEEIKVGVVAVAIGGAPIEHLDKDFDPKDLETQADWYKSFMKEYNNAPYATLLEHAKKAQKSGVIKGILLHQGESNNGQQAWCGKVKKIYDDLLSDLGLEPNSIPLLAGEVVTSEMGGACGLHNSVIATLPKTLPTAHVVSAANLPQKGDGLHFTAHGYRVLGCRYATEMLKTMGVTDPKVSYSEEIPFVPTPEPSEGDFTFDFKYFNPKIFADGTFKEDTGEFKGGQWGFGGWEYTTPIDLSGYKYIVAELSEDEHDGAEFRVFDTASYWEKPYTSKFNGGKLIVAELDGMMKNLDNGKIEALNTSNVYRVGFWVFGNRPIYIKQVFATNTNPYDAAVSEIEAEGNFSGDMAVYNMMGVKVADSLDEAVNCKGIYICGGHKIFMK